MCDDRLKPSSPPSHYARRVRDLREKAGRSIPEVAEAAGMSVPNYCDAESFDDDLTYAMTLAQVSRLAETLGTNLRELFAPADEAPVKTARVTFEALASQLRIATVSRGLEAVEDGVGWYLESFLAAPASAWEQPLEFLTDVCEFLGVSWFDAVPTGPCPSTPPP